MVPAIGGDGSLILFQLDIDRDAALHILVAHAAVGGSSFHVTQPSVSFLAAPTLPRSSVAMLLLAEFGPKVVVETHTVCLKNWPGFVPAHTRCVELPHQSTVRRFRLPGLV
jgi:hypothetical protein